MSNSRDVMNPDKASLQDTQKVVNELLSRCSSNVFKSYLPELAQNYKVLPVNDDTRSEEMVAFFDITKLVLEEKDNAVEKLKNVYHFLAYSDNSIALIVRRKHDYCRISLALGIKRQDSEAVIKLSESISDAITGNFPGSSCGPISSYEETEDSPFEALKKGLFFDENSKAGDRSSYNSIAVASNIASEFSEDYLEQGLEKVIDGVIPDEGQEYTLIILAEAIPDTELEAKKQELYQIYTALSPYSKQQQNWSLAESKNWGKSFNAGWAFVVNLGGGSNSGGSESITNGTSVEVTQYAVSHTMEIIEKQMERIERCSALGVYNIAAYVLSPTCNLASEVAHMYMSLTQGNESYYEKPAINVWNAQSRDNECLSEIAGIARYLRRLSHPSFEKKKGADVNWPASVTSTSMISGAELALAMSLPNKSLPGFTTIKCASFGREITSYDAEYEGSVHLGCIHHMHHDEEKRVELNRDSLASHTFVTGSTGTGKSNTIYTLLDSLKTKFMVIEPAKGEYKYAFGNNVKVYGTNPKQCELLRINPFAFNSGIHVYEHIDRILDVFNVCWPMYAAMPAVLKDAIIKAYEDCGWDMINSTNSEGMIFPTFADVCSEIDQIILNSDYSEENKGNYRGSLKTRLNSLTNGINKLIFCDGDTADADLFGKNVIIDLSRVGSAENKSLIMGILIIRLQEYRMSEGKINSPLQHVTVLEEAHNILRRAEGINSDSGNITQKSVEMIANAIAEMRTYGEGFIIADQAPGLLDMSVIRNTNTKIILRLPDESDRMLVGKSAGLNEAQINELASLQRGVAAIYQNEWVEPILCKIKKHELVGEYHDEVPAGLNTEDPYARRFVNSCVYDPQYLVRHSDVNFIDCLGKIHVDGILKARLIDYSRLPYDQKKDIWQSMAFRFFGIDKCVDKMSKEIKWRDVLLQKLTEYEFNDDVSFDRGSETLYRFVQIMALEAIIQLGKGQPEKSLILTENMREYKSSFLK